LVSSALAQARPGAGRSGRGAARLPIYTCSYFTEDSAALGALLKGHDTIIIRNGRVDRKALQGAHMSTDDLAEDLRQEGIQHPNEVKEARLERSGKLSVIKKSRANSAG
jgi:uncharacterized membrane protein YcaP (DUF421 family)